MTPWTDRSGKFSALKAAILFCLVLPALGLAFTAASGGLGPRPVTEAIHTTGSWAIRFLFVSLAVTPLRRIADWNRIIIVRRMVGLAAFFYALGHFSLYIIDLKFDLAKVASEIVLRFYLTIGFVALVCLAIMAATSTDAAIRRLGRNWNILHKLVYVVGILATLHFFMQTKADVFEATIMSGLFALLILYRMLQWRRFDLGNSLILLSAAVAAALATVLFEYAWYGIATGIDPARVLAANLQFGFRIRPTWWVLAVGVAVATLPILRRLTGVAPKPVRVRRATSAAP